MGMGLCCGFCCLPIGIAAITTGILAIKEIDASEGTKTGRGHATAGIMLGAFSIVPFVLVIVFMTLLRSSSPPVDATEVSNPEAMVRVIVWNDTKANPLPDRSEIWFRGHGPWWLQRDTISGGDTKDLGRRRIGQKFTGNEGVVLYPEGRQTNAEGMETGGIYIPLMMTSEMNSEGSVRDSIVITIRDDEIEIMGEPLREATGSVSMTVKRVR